MTHRLCFLFQRGTAQKTPGGTAQATNLDARTAQEGIPPVQCRLYNMKLGAG